MKGKNTPNFFTQRREGAKDKKNSASFFASPRLCVRCFPVLLFFFVLLALSGCSSAPKKPTEIFTERNTAASQLDLANHTANRGRYEDALRILEGARLLAVGTDDPPLRIKTSISRGNILFSLGRSTEAFAEWESAEAEGESSGQPVLAALARICTIRSKLVLLSGEAGGTDAAVEEFKTRLGLEMAAVRSEPNYTALGNIALGLAEKQMKNWAEAESAVRKALSFHENNFLLEDAAYDWFLIASIRSVAGNYDAALEALGTAIRFDRRAENGFGLASSWQAMGDVYQKAGRMEEAQSAWSRAAEIYRAIGLEDRAEKLER